MKAKKLFVTLLLVLVSGTAFSDVEIGDMPYERLGVGGDGEEININEHHGKVLIITFWATWCGPCMKEIPLLSGIQKRVGSEQLQVFAVSYRESKKMFNAVSETLSDNPIIFSYDKRGYVARRYGVKAIPHMVIVGKDGKVSAKHIGYSEQQIPKLVEEINALLLSNRG